MNLPDMGGRKFIFALFIALLGFAAMFWGKVTSSEWKDLVVWCYLIFSTANVTSNVADMVTTMMKSKDKSEK